MSGRDRTLTHRVRPPHVDDAQVGQIQAKLAETLGIEALPPDSGLGGFRESCPTATAGWS
jgi:hypothetical protein